MMLDAAKEIVRLLGVIDTYAESSAAACRELKHLRANLTELRLQLNRADALNAELADRNIQLSIDLTKAQKRLHSPEVSN